MALREVMRRFSVTSLLMWALPLSVLYVFNNNLVPGVARMSPESYTLLSGFLAVISVNIVIGVYVCMALRDPPTASAPQPDPAFAARASAKLGEVHTSGSRDEQSQQASQGDKKSE